MEEVDTEPATEDAMSDPSSNDVPDKELVRMMLIGGITTEQPGDASTAPAVTIEPDSETE